MTNRSKVLQNRFWGLFLGCWGPEPAQGQKGGSEAPILSTESSKSDESDDSVERIGASDPPNEIYGTDGPKRRFFLQNHQKVMKVRFCGENRRLALKNGSSKTARR